MYPTVDFTRSRYGWSAPTTRADWFVPRLPSASIARADHVVWEAVPAWICTQCGEPLFEAQEVESIQRALVALERESAALIA